MIEFKRHISNIFVHLTRSLAFSSKNNNEMTPYSPSSLEREKKQKSSSSLDQFNQSFAYLNTPNKRSEWTSGKNKLIICITTSNPSIS